MTAGIAAFCAHLTKPETQYFWTMKRGGNLDHTILILGVLVLVSPQWLAFASSAYTAQGIARDGIQYMLGNHFLDTWGDLLSGQGGMFMESEGKVGGVSFVSVLTMLKNSAILGVGFAAGKIAISMLAAYAIVYFRFSAGSFLFWIIFSSLLLPLEVRIVRGYEPVNGSALPFQLDLFGELGAGRLLHGRVGETTVTVRASGDGEIPFDNLHAEFPAAAMHFFDKETGARL